MNWEHLKRQRLAKKRKPKTKPKPHYWRVLNILKRLRVKYREYNRGTASFHITIPDFGIALRFSPTFPATKYQNWDVVDVNLKELEINEIKFGRHLMWCLISKGYFAYLRNGEKGDNQLFRHYLIDQGWAHRIIDKRLELYNNEPRHKFMITRNKRLRQLSVHYIITHHPDFFDYLVEAHLEW